MKFTFSKEESFGRRARLLLIPAAALGFAGLAGCEKQQDYEDPTADGIRVAAGPNTTVRSGAIRLSNVPGCRHDANVSVAGGRGATIEEGAVVIDYQNCPRPQARVERRGRSTRVVSDGTVIYEINEINIDARSVDLSTKLQSLSRPTLPQQAAPRSDTSEAALAARMWQEHAMAAEAGIRTDKDAQARNGIAQAGGRGVAITGDNNVVDQSRRTNLNIGVDIRGGRGRGDRYDGDRHYDGARDGYYRNGRDRRDFDERRYGDQRTDYERDAQRRFDEGRARRAEDRREERGSRHNGDRRRPGSDGTRERERSGGDYRGNPQDSQRGRSFQR